MGRKGPKGNIEQNEENSKIKQNDVPFNEEEYYSGLSDVEKEKESREDEKKSKRERSEEILFEDDSQLLDEIDSSVFENVDNPEEMKDICKRLIKNGMLEFGKKGKIKGVFIEVGGEKRPSKLFDSFLKAGCSREQALKSRLQVRTKEFKNWFGDWEKINRFYSKGFEMLVGIPGSGKSTYLKKLNIPNVIVVSPDDIRREITGSISDQSRNSDVWRITEERINKYLSEGKYVILDATNVNTKNRTRFLDRIKRNNKGLSTYATMFEADPEESKRRIAKDIENKVDRSTVPDDVVDRMYSMYQQTVDVIKSEGFTEVFSSSDYENASKVIDENGEPLLVYHGSARRFKEFDVNKIGSNTGDKSGFYFTDSWKVAKDYYSRETGNGWDNLKLMFGLSRKYKPTVYSCFIKALNPYTQNFNGDYDNIGREKIITEATEKGYDVVILKNIIDGPGVVQDAYVVFHPDQIKMEIVK